MRNLLIGIIPVVLLSGCSWFTKAPSRVDNPIVTGVDYVGMTVSDLAATSQFYRENADLVSVQQTQLVANPIVNQLVNRDNSNVSTHLMKSANAQLRFMQFENPSTKATNANPVEVYGPGIAHVCLQVAKHTQTYEAFLEHGAKHIGDKDMVHLNEKNPVYYAYVRDLNDAMVEIEHVDVAALNLPEPPKNARRIRHVSLATPNMDRIVDFYSTLLETSNPRRAGTFISLFGDKLDSISGLPDSEIEMAWFQLRNLELEIIQYHSHPTSEDVKPRPIDAVGYNSIVFQVTDLQQAKAKLLEAGGTMVTEPADFDDGKIMFARDPDGNLIGFQVAPADSPLSSHQFKDNGI